MSVRQGNTAPATGGPAVIGLAAAQRMAAEDGHVFTGPSQPDIDRGRPQEIMSAVVFLASSESSYMTGAELFVGGGEERL